VQVVDDSHWRTGAGVVEVVVATHSPEESQMPAPWLHGSPSLIVSAHVSVPSQALHVKAQDLGAFIHAIGTMPDHIHVAISIPPTNAVAEIVRQMKGSSSWLVNHHESSAKLGWFGWQREYGVHTFSARSLPTVISNLERQAEHHASQDIWSAFEQLPEIPPSSNAPPG
jgi:putative transposase